MGAKSCPELCPPHTQINFFIFVRILHLLAAKLQAHQMRYTDYKFRWVWALGVGGRQEACGTPGARGSVGGGGGTRAPGGAGLVAQSLPPQAGQVHADPHPPVGGPRGGVCLCDRRACPGHPALRQALLRPLPQLLPGACPPLNQPPNPQASLGAALTSPISPGPAGGCSLLFPQQGGRWGGGGGGSGTSAGVGVRGSVDTLAPPLGCEPFVSTCTYWAQFPGHWVSGLLRWVSLSPSSGSAPEGEGVPRCSQTPAFCGDRACLAPHPGRHIALQGQGLGDPERVARAGPGTGPTRLPTPGAVGVAAALASLARGQSTAGGVPCRQPHGQAHWWPPQ